MASKNPLHDFYIYPRAEKADALHGEVHRLGRLQEGLGAHRKEVLQDLMRSAGELLPSMQLVEHLTPYEFLLLSVLLDHTRRLRELEEKRWVHPPFP